MLSVFALAALSLAPPACSLTTSRRTVLATLPLAALRPASSSAAANPERFSIVLPPGYVRSSRKATQGTIFVGGNFPRASVVSVTAWPVDDLLQQDAAAQSLPGLPAPTLQRAGSVSALSDLGSAQELAMLLVRARDRDATAGALQSELKTFALGDDKLRFKLETQLPVADPDEVRCPCG